ncbi:MAG TPA: metalloregulator ArsR/SmtB family transcription factor [Gaiella sp.]|jgi:DNA-binding transcriptional ArsR family regulator
MDALGDPTRRHIFELLRRGPRAVAALAADVPVSRPAVSQHLRVLERAGLVSHRREGTRHVYAVEAGGLDEIRTWLDGFWDDALARFADAANEEGRRQ